MKIACPEAPRLARRLEQADGSRSDSGRDRCDLHDARAGGAHGPGDRGEVGGHCVEVVIRENNTIRTPSDGAEQIREAGLPLDVDILGARASARAASTSLALFFRAAEPAAFPGRAGR